MLSRSVPALALLLGVVSAQWPDPVPSTGNLSYVHDPSVVQKDGTYYRFSTFGEILVASAPSMTGPWTALGHALNGGSVINLAGNDVLWAPDVSFFEGQYYMYYAVSTSGSQNSEIGVATSTQLVPGSWTDHGSINVPKSDDYNKIDPNLIVSADGTPLLTFGSYWHDIYQVRMADTPLSIAPNTVPKNIERNSTARAGSGQQQPEVMEGSYQFSYRDGVNGTGNLWYYLFWSSGDCCSQPPTLPAQGDEYKIMVGRSRNPTGPWTDNDGVDILNSGGKLVLGSHGQHVYAPGGQGVMYDDATKSPLMYYHYVDPTIGYGAYDFQFGFNYLDFGSGWPKVVAQPLSNATTTSNDGAQSPVKTAAKSAGSRGVSLSRAAIAAAVVGVALVW